MKCISYASICLKYPLFQSRNIYEFKKFTGQNIKISTQGRFLLFDVTTGTTGDAHLLEATNFKIPAFTNLHNFSLIAFHNTYVTVLDIKKIDVTSFSKCYSLFRFF